MSLDPGHWSRATMSGMFPVGTMVGHYTADGTLIRHVPLDVETGKLLEPVDGLGTDGSWLLLVSPDGRSMPFTQPGWIAHGRRRVTEDDLDES